MILLCISQICYADVQRIGKMPQGTFKKARNGKIIQYNSQGKKIGTYKMVNGRYLIVK